MVFSARFSASRILILRQMKTGTQSHFEPECMPLHSKKMKWMAGPIISSRLESSKHLLLT